MKQAIKYILYFAYTEAGIALLSLVTAGVSVIVFGDYDKFMSLFSMWFVIYQIFMVAQLAKTISRRD